MQMGRESYRHLLGCVLQRGLVFYPQLKLQEVPISLKAYTRDLRPWVRCYHALLSQPCVWTQIERIISASSGHQGLALLLTAVTPTRLLIQDRLFQPGQMYHLLGRKEDSPEAPSFLLHHLHVAVAKRLRKTRDRRGWAGFCPLNRQDGFACHTYPQKRTKQVLIPCTHLFMAGTIM